MINSISPKILPPKPDHYVKHKEKFDIEPIIIGIFWDDTEKEKDGIIEAIKNNKPYNERELLTKDELKAFDKGELVF